MSDIKDAEQDLENMVMQNIISNEMTSVESYQRAATRLFEDLSRTISSKMSVTRPEEISPLLVALIQSNERIHSIQKATDALAAEARAREEIEELLVALGQSDERIHSTQKATDALAAETKIMLSQLKGLI
jgi:prolyl-tRNA synthetase